MKRTLLVVLAAGLVIAPAAAAKGPHAIVTTPSEPVEPGQPWRFTVELNEFRHPPAPVMRGRLGDRTVRAAMKRTPSSIEGATAFSVTMTFPRRGEWRLRLVAGMRRFALPAVDVGGAQAPQDYVAFPIGSAMEGEGGGFSPSAAPGGETPADPAEPADPAVPAVAEADEGAGIGPWLLPLLGVALAGAGVAAVTRRGGR